MPTIYAQAQQRKSLRQQRRDARICLDCGEHPAGLNADETPSRYCDGCRMKRANNCRHGKRGFQPHSGTRSAGRPPIVYDDGEAISYLDSSWFKKDCVLIFAAIPENSHITISGLRQALGNTFPERHIHDIIEALVGAGLIERAWGALPSRFRRLPTRKQDRPKRGWQGDRI